MNTSDIEFRKLYFINMFKKGKIKFSSYFEAQQKCPSLAVICEKLTPEQLKFLTEKIEELL